MLSKNARSVADFAVGGVFGLFPAERWSLIGKHRDRPCKPLTQSLDKLLLLAGCVSAWNKGSDATSMTVCHI
jgi:hypothetical protein